MTKRSWFSLVKRFFSSDTRSNRKKEKKRRWLFGKQKVRRLTSVSATTETRDSLVSEEVEKQKSLAAVNSPIIANTPAAVVELIEQNEQITEEVYEQLVLQKPVCCKCAEEMETLEAAATVIQTAFRGYLARKALRALKGVVRLQALIRGRAVRRQAITTLQRLQSVVNIQSQVCAKRIQTLEKTMHSKHDKELHDFRGRDIKIDENSQRWDDRMLSNEEESVLLTSKREAATKRERIKENTFNHRASTESNQNKVNRNMRFWLEQWVDTQLAKQEDLQNLDANREDVETRKLRLRNLNRLESAAYFPRRSYHRKQRSIGDNEFAGSPVFPTYMAATASAKAKVRSMSSPRLRPISLDTCSDTTSPYKHKMLSPISSINSEATSISRITNFRSGSFSQRSPSLRGVPGHVKAKRSPKDLRFN